MYKILELLIRQILPEISRFTHFFSQNNKLRLFKTSIIKELIRNLFINITDSIAILINNNVLNNKEVYLKFTEIHVCINIFTISLQDLPRSDLK